MKTEEALLLRGSVIGKEITITKYQGKKRNNKTKITDETKNTLVVDLDGQDKRFLKRSLVFRLKMNNKTIEIEANRLIGRITERIKG